jgi:hypothetical protein
MELVDFSHLIQIVIVNVAFRTRHHLFLLDGADIVHDLHEAGCPNLVLVRQILSPITTRRILSPGNYVTPEAPQPMPTLPRPWAVPLSRFWRTAVHGRRTRSCAPQQHKVRRIHGEDRKGHMGQVQGHRGQGGGVAHLGAAWQVGPYP